MFENGNPFQTQTDQSQVNFTDPANPANLFPGWGFNPAYRTPAFDAPYRPAYSGPNPYAAYERPGVLKSAGQLFSPLTPEPYWGNPISNNSAAYNSLGNAPTDAAAHIGQNYVMPGLVFAAFNAKPIRGAFGSLGGGFAGGMASKLGMSAANAGRMASVGKFAMGFGGPLTLALAAIDTLDTLAAQPFNQQRQIGEDVHDNFSGITFGAGFGNGISGRGLSRRQASDIGANVSTLGIKDATFGSNQMGAIASMGMRAGLFDDVGGGDITKRVSSIAAQIKTIVAISKDPNIQSAIEELAKLRMGGASLTGGAGSAASMAYSSLGMNASMAGASVQRMMGTVGAQGQYMYQMNGLTPYLGAMAASNAYAGFASAQRFGVLSTAQLARMGGVEGATQTSVAGQVSAMNTPYNRMRAMNFFTGGRDNGVVNTIGDFGGHAARDPLAAKGRMDLYGDAALSNQNQREGSLTAEKNAEALLKANGRDGANGYSPEELSAILTSSGMMDQNQARAYIAMRAAQTNPTIVRQNLAAIRAQSEEQIRQTYSQHGMYSGGALGWLHDKKRKLGDMATSVAEAVAYPVGRAGASAVDWLEEVGDDIMHGNSLSKDKISGAESYRINTEKVSGMLGSTSDEAMIAKELNRQAAQKGSQGDLARVIMQNDFKGNEAKKAFSAFMKGYEGPHEGLQKQKAGIKDSDSFFQSASKYASDATITKTERDFSQLESLTGISDKDKLQKILNQTYALVAQDGDLGYNLGDRIKGDSFSDLRSVLPSDNKSAVAKVEELFTRGAAMQGKAFHASTREEGKKALAAELLANNSAVATTIANSKSNVRYSEHTSAMTSFENGVRGFLTGAGMILDAANKFNGKSTSPGIGTSLLNGMQSKIDTQNRLTDTLGLTSGIPSSQPRKGPP